MPVKLSVDFSKQKFYSTGGSFKPYLKNEWEKPTTKITLTLPSKDLVQNQWQIRNSTDKQKLREFNTSKSALQRMLKEIFLGKKCQRSKRPTKTNPRLFRKW